MLSGTQKPSRPEPKRLIFRNVIRKIILEDWMLKLVALAITLGLWLGVTGLSTPATKRLSVRLLPSIANDVEITNNPISEVDIVVSGDERRVKSMTGKDIVALLDLTTLQPGDRIVSLSPDNVFVDLPQGVRLEEIQPSRIAVKIEAVEELELPVKADLQGKPADGFEVYSETVLPQKVRVRGPAGFMATLQAVSTGPISVEGRKDDLNAKQVPIDVPNPKSTIFNTVVDVTVRIGEKRIERTINLPPSAQTGDRRATLTLYGPKTALGKLRPADLKIEMIRGDAGDIPQAVLPPELVDIVEVKRLKLN